MVWAGGRALVVGYQSLNGLSEQLSSIPAVPAETAHATNKAIPLAGDPNVRKASVRTANFGAPKQHQTLVRARPISVAAESPDLSTSEVGDPKVILIWDGKSETSDSIITASPNLPRGRQSSDRRLFNASGYIFLRGVSQQAGLSGNPSLGGSQMAVFVDGPVVAQVAGIALRPFARVTTAGKRVSLQEAAFGLSAELRSGPMVARAAVERRTALNGIGRNALSARATAGLYQSVARTPLTISAYGQVGVVGIKRKDGFVEGEVRLALTEGQKFRRFKPGVASWGAMQPRASRADIGPTVEIPVTLGSTGVALRADWRFRVVGNARPASGPSLTIATDF